MSMEKKQAILQKIKEYDTIMLFRHFRPDGDAKGSTKGLQGILKATWPEKQVYLINDDHSDYLAFMGDDEPEVADEVYEKALGIVLEELPEWQCCGAVYPQAKDEIATKLSAVRSLAAARDLGQELVSVCSACHHVLKRVNGDMKNDEYIALRLD